MAVARFRTWWTRLALVIVALGLVSNARGQFKSDEIDQSLRAQGSVVKRYAADPNSDASKKPLFENYITKYYIPLMTQAEANALGELGKLRYELFRQYVWPANPAVQTWLNATLLQRMQDIYQDSAYHPSVRYNALLILGMLDEQYGVAPKPLAAANKSLVMVLSDGLKNPSASPAVIVGSLIGLERHAKYRAGLPQEAQDMMAKGFMAVAGREKFPQEMSNSVRNWIRAQAAGGLAAMGTVGDKGQYHQALMKLIDDASLGVENRCEIAGMLPKLQYKAGDPIDGPAAVKSLTQLAVDYGADEAKLARKFEDLQIDGGGGLYASGSGGSFKSFQIVNDQLVYPRRRPVGYLTDLQAGLRAIEPAVPADQQQVIQALQAAMKPVIDIAVKQDSLDLDVVNQIQTMAEEFNKIAPSAGSKPVEAPEEKETEGLF
ncbi:MAG: hypothetical protein WD851_18100 [Pirellulales bacterium]